MFLNTKNQIKRYALLLALLLTALTIIWGCADNESNLPAGLPAEQISQIKSTDLAQTQPYTNIYANDGFITQEHPQCAINSQIAAKDTRAPTFDPRLIKQAQALAAQMLKLTIKIHVTKEFRELSQDWNNEQILNHVYSNDSALRKIFASRLVTITQVNNCMLVKLFADDKTTILIEDCSSTPGIDRMYGVIY